MIDRKWMPVAAIALVAVWGCSPPPAADERQAKPLPWTDGQLAGGILVRTAERELLFERASMSLSELREELRNVQNPAEGVARMRVLVGYHGATDRGPEIVVEFGGEAVLDESATINQWRDASAFVVPAGSVVECGVPENPLSEPYEFHPRYGSRLAYQIGCGRFGFSLPGRSRSGAEGFDVRGEIVWAHQESDDDPEYYDVYVLKAEPEMVARVANWIRVEREACSDQHLLEKILPALQRRVCDEFGLSPAAVFFRYHPDKHVGVDEERGLIYFDSYNP